MSRDAFLQAKELEQYFVGAFPGWNLESQRTFAFFRWGCFVNDILSWMHFFGLSPNVYEKQRHSQRKPTNLPTKTSP